jgi:hypothetical protein
MAGQTVAVKPLITTVFLAAILAVPAARSQDAFSPTLNMDGFPDWLIEQMARETNRPGEKKVTLPLRDFETLLTGARQSDPQALEIGYYVTSDITSESPLECWVVTASIDPAAMLRNLAAVSIDETSKSHGELKQTFTFYVDAGAIEDYPYLAYESLYMMGAAPNARIGLIKVRIASKDGLHFICAHNEVGYRNTFARAFESFVANASFETEDTRTYRRDLLRLSVGTQATGYMQYSFGIDEDGDTVAIIQSASLNPIDQSTVTAEDTFDIGYWTPDGALISRRAVKASNGELSMNLDIVNNGDETYAISGLFQGKNIEYVIESSASPMSPLDQSLEIQRLIADPDRDSTVALVWEPTIDPTAFVETSFVFDPDKRDELVGTSILGPLQIETQVDHTGMAITGTIDMGPVSIDIQRLVYVGDMPLVAASE